MKSDVVPGEILVRFRSNAGADKTAQARRLTVAGGREIPFQVEHISPWEIVEGLRLARVAPGETDDAIKALKARADVLYAEPNYIRRALKSPNDPRYSEMWGLKNSTSVGQDVHAEQAWEVTTGSKDVVVGIVDSGVDINHEDLRDNVWTNSAEIPGNGSDDDNNGYVDDIHGWDFAHNDNSVFDYALPTYPPPDSFTGDVDEHGTHVAGTIGARGNNGIGVAGVNWQVSLMSLKFLTGVEGFGSSANLLKAFSYAKSMRELWTSSGGTRGANIRVLNNSYGGFGFSQAELEAIRALGDSGILFVVAAGNDGSSNDVSPTYPANYISTNLISVAASTSSGIRANFSNYGPGTVHMTAPGDKILSTTPKNTYELFSGTSMAAPHVAGGAALLCAAYPSISVTKLRSVLLYGGYVAPWQYIYTYPISSGRSLVVNGSLQSHFGSDTTSPAAVGNLRLISSNFPNLNVQWVTPGDDGTSGKIAAYEVRLSDIEITDPAKFELAKPLPGPVPDDPGTFESPIDLTVLWRHPVGFIAVRAVDEAGNVGPISSLNYSVSLDVADPYTVTESAATPLSSGGTPLGLNVDDGSKSYYLPFSFRFYQSNFQNVTVSSNGAIYAGFTGFTTEPLPSEARFNIYRIIAGAWDDLRTDRRAGDDVYVVQPDANRIIFRWQAVTYDTPIGVGVTRGENPVNFEIELQSNGTIITRYGAGNQKLFPIVGINFGSPDSYLVESHTSIEDLKDLTNAPNVTFALRNPPPPPTANLRLTTTYGPSPVPVGGQETYNFQVHNAGPNEATNVVLTDQLPAGLNFVSCTTSQGNCSAPAAGSNGTVIVNLGQLNAYATANITIVTQVTAPAGTTITNSASVTSSNFDNETRDNTVLSEIHVGQVADGTGVASVSSAYFSSVVVKTDGTVWGFGKDDYYVLGNGTSGQNITSPVKAQNVSVATSVSTGGTHTLALRSDGTVLGWGSSNFGENGGTSPYPGMPLPIVGITNVVAIAAGYQHSMALRNDGTVWVWGSNDEGQLGIGSTDNLRHSTPQQIPGLTNVSFISAGTGYSVAVRNDGTVWTWGNNLNGQLGDSSSTRNIPSQVAGVSGVKAVAAGYNHVLALKTDGTVLGWGMNAFGQSGPANFANVNPTPGQIPNLTGVVSIGAGYGFSLAVKSDGTVWGWGLNAQGQLGNGLQGSNPQPNPTQVSSITTAVMVAAGNTHGLALLADGTLRSWGDNANGQLGDGTTFMRLAPVAVMAAVIKAPNAIDYTANFVRQHYLDFLNREPDPAGLQFWIANIDGCGADVGCREVKRIDTSAAFFLSIEFQETGYLVHRFYKASFGRRPLLSEFLPDTRTISNGVIVNAPGWEELLESNRQSFAANWVTRPPFVSTYSTLSNANYVNALIANTGASFSQSTRDALISALNTNGKSRAQVLREIVENQSFYHSEYNPAFVEMQYFGYLGRNPQDPPDNSLIGFNFWLNKLNEFGGDYRRAEMVKAFLVSEEYRKRFGPP